MPADADDSATPGADELLRHVRSLFQDGCDSFQESLDMLSSGYGLSREDLVRRLNAWRDAGLLAWRRFEGKEDLIVITQPQQNGATTSAKRRSRDANDHLRQGGRDEVRRMADASKTAELPRDEHKRNQNAKPSAWRNDLIHPQKLFKEHFPDVKYVVQGIIPEGVTILASRPKLGKSWFILQISAAVATGAGTLATGDLPVLGDVLYLALEDNPRRLKRRLTKYFGTQSEAWPERLQLATTWRRLDQGGIDDLREWCQSVNRPTLIAIDTLKKVRKPKNPGKTDYDADYEAFEGLMKLPSEFPGLSIVVAHHDRKMEADDVFDTVSGTLGLTGGVDTIAILKRSAKGTTLHVEGRDLVDAVEKAIRFDRETCRWHILGEASEVQRSDERSRILAALTDLADGLTVSEIQGAAQLGSRGAVDMLLFRMVQNGDIYRVGRGRYSRMRPPAAEVSEKCEIGKTELRYGENPAKRHSVSSVAQSNTSNAHGLSSPAEDVSEFLAWALKSGRRLVSDIEASARAEGLLGGRQPIRTAKSFKLAKDALGVVIEREGFGPGSKVYWRLPDAAEPDQ